MQFNYDSVSEWHVDDAKMPAIVVGIGEYEGGHLEIKGHGAVDLAGKALLFDPQAPHKAMPARGNKTTILALMHPRAETISPEDREWPTAMVFEHRMTHPATRAKMMKTDTGASR